MVTNSVPRQLEFVWFKCPNGHDFLIDWEQAYGDEPMYCHYCDEWYFVDQGQLGEIEHVRDAFPNLQG